MGRPYQTLLRITLAVLIFSVGVILGGCGNPPPPPPPPPPTAHIFVCVLNSHTDAYSCNVNFKIIDSAGYSQIGGVSVIVAKPK